MRRRWREAREALGLSRERFGALISVSSGAVYEIEQRGRSTSIETASAWADACGVSVDWLLGRTDVREVAA